MVINDKEAEDLGLTRELMWRRFQYISAVQNI